MQLNLSRKNIFDNPRQTIHLITIKASHLLHGMQIIAEAIRVLGIWNGKHPTHFQELKYEFLVQCKRKSDK